jgi:hypothetical protein
MARSATLDLVVRRAISLHLSLVEWIDQKQVVASGQDRDPAGPTFTDLAHAARTLSA